MSTNQDISQYLELFKIPPGTVPLGLELMTNGYCTGMEGYYRTHPDIPGATMIYLAIDPPSNNQSKGTVTLHRVNEKEWKIGVLNAKTKTFATRTYAGYTVYLHPDHYQLAQDYNQGKTLSNTPIEVGLLLIKGRGVVSFSAI